MRHFKNKLIHFLVFGSIYLNIEIITRALGNSLVGFNGISELSLCGWTSLWMFPIGGFCAVIIGTLNDYPGYYNLKMWQQTIMGGSLIIAVELLSGIFLNIILGLHIWDYSNNKFNFMGQINLQNSIAWYILSIVIIWLDDELSYYIYRDEKPGSLINYFKKVVTLQ